jgi:UDP-N-acetylmuramoylalanine--D-glutamate ligase
MTDYTGRHAVVLGLGLTGFSLARHLAAHGANVRVADTRATPPFAGKLAAALPGIEVAAGPFTAHTFAGADLVAISPGIAKDQPAIKAAVAGGAELVGDIELFARALPPEQKVLAITGSNGKSTVTALTGALCRASGLVTVVAGNIGDAVLDTLPAGNDWNDPHARFAGRPPRGHWPDVYVLELSSFQLETTSTLMPTAATVLNITDNHLDRYAGMDEYAAAKARIFHGGGIQVLNRDDPRSLALGISGRRADLRRWRARIGGAWGLVDRGTSRDGRPETWLARGRRLLVPMAELNSSGVTTR